ncbi:hypothetical protein M1397_03430 [Candidatus Marsarchaeota archaeon]|jgi:hypothetical protein|nr:hypothetical protein [Candidatus Marsarchaeota archaeon]
MQKMKLLYAFTFKLLTFIAYGINGFVYKPSSKCYFSDKKATFWTRILRPKRIYIWKKRANRDKMAGKTAMQMQKDDSATLIPIASDVISIALDICTLHNRSNFNRDAAMHDLWLANLARPEGIQVLDLMRSDLHKFEKLQRKEVISRDTCILGAIGSTLAVLEIAKHPNPLFAIAASPFVAITLYFGVEGHYTAKKTGDMAESILAEIQDKMGTKLWDPVPEEIHAKLGPYLLSFSTR